MVVSATASSEPTGSGRKRKVDFSVSDKDPEVFTSLRHHWYRVGSLQEKNKKQSEVTPFASYT